MNKSSTVAAIVWLDQIVAAAKDRRSEFAAQLDAEARQQYATDGTAATWRIPEIASVSSRVTHTSVRVSDEAAFLAWVKAEHPDKVETVEQVRPGWRSRLLDEVLAGADVPPGVEIVPGGKFAGISVTATREAKHMFGAVAVEGLKHAALSAGSVVAPAFAEIEAGPEET